jgi:hypothetical protein
MKKLGLGFGLAVLLAVPAFAQAPAGASITGTWLISGDVQGVGVSETCIVTQATDGKLKGSCDVDGMGKYDATGSVTDKTVIITHPGTYQGQDLTLTYTGKINSDGGITGTIDVDPMAVTGSFSAKKSDAATPPAPAPGA